MSNNGCIVYASQETSDILIYQSIFFFIQALDIPTTVIVIYLTYAYCVIANSTATVEITF